jgi:DNA topoisomerase I
MRGISRRRRGKGFQYTGPDGKTIREPGELERIASLAVPPAWTDVWICPYPNGHLQATGRDARGRKQYRYHPRWREARDETKYHRMLAFGHALPRIRRTVSRHLQGRSLSRERVLAAVVRLLDETTIRVGNEEYARTNGSFGLTTIRDDHVDVRGSRIRFRFRGKGGKMHEVAVEDARVARIVRRCEDLPGQELFAYLNEDGEPVDVDSEDVNGYIAEVAGEEFTAKDFRTWTGTVLAAWALQEFEQHTSAREANSQIVAAIESVARRLGNTPAVCRRCYVHPDVFEAHLEGSLREALAGEAKRTLSNGLSGLTPEEAAVLTMLTGRLAAA